MENCEPNIHKKVKINPNPNPNNSEPSESSHNSQFSESDYNSEASEFDNSIEVIENPALQEITQALHNDLRDLNNECGIYDYIQALHNIDQEIPPVAYPDLINLDNYPGLSTIILDSVRNEGENLFVNENSLTANSINLILQGILDGLNAENPQFQELQYLQISSNTLNGSNIAMNEQSMNLLSDIILNPNNQITRLDIRNNGIEPANLNILLDRIAENQNLTANLQEIDFSLNLINQDSVELLNTILANNPNINFEAEYSIPEGIELGNLANHPRFCLELQVPVNQVATPSTSSGSFKISSLNSSFNL